MLSSCGTRIRSTRNSLGQAEVELTPSRPNKKRRPCSQFLIVRARKFRRVSCNRRYPGKIKMCACTHSCLSERRPVVFITTSYFLALVTPRCPAAHKAGPRRGGGPSESHPGPSLTMSFASTSAPLATSSSTTLRCPFSAAKWRGVQLSWRVEWLSGEGASGEGGAGPHT